MSDIDDAARQVVAAIENEGRRPDYHRHIMRKHRHEWPVLWAALDKLRRAAKEA